MSRPIFLTVEAIADQLTSRDAALLTWVAGGLIAIVWSMARRGAIGRAVLSVIRTLVALRIVGMVALVAVWEVLVVYLARCVDLWDSRLLKDTVVIVTIGALMTGFKAIAVMDGKESMRGEARSLFALVVAMQIVANLQTLPYLAELVLVPAAVLLGGIQAVVNHHDEHRAARPVISATIIVLSLCVFLWSVYKVASSLGSTEWETVGRSFALGFWLPAVLLPAIYSAALGMQYGKTISMMKIVRSPSLGARVDFYLHHGLSLRRLSAFSRSRGRAHEYARASGRDRRMAILRSPPN